MTTTQINDGGPAFPNVAGTFSSERRGMSLRAYFSGAIAAALSVNGDFDPDALADDAVRYADALIARLSETAATLDQKTAKETWNLLARLRARMNATEADLYDEVMPKLSSVIAKAEAAS